MHNTSTSPPRSGQTAIRRQHFRDRWHDSWLAGAAKSISYAAPGVGIRALKVVAALAPIVVLYACFGLVVGWISTITGNSHTGLLATVTTPVRHYLFAHTDSAGLPLTGGAAYAFWEILGLVSFLLAVCRSTAARVLWLLWGAATVAMAWMGTPADGQTVAAGVTLLALTGCSAAALRGLRLRQPPLHVRDLIRPENTRIELHLHQAHSTHAPYRLSHGDAHLN
ncbi:hypothetical protein ABR737_00555 [Streptomyces sp. Edi2]|uniref:hypothetical protein n=1 Tax=Streptomyces sp. Edi2 TaxID=3162528 RepID=UPI0033057E34